MNPNLIPTIMTIVLIVCAGVGFLIGFFKGAIKGAVDIAVTAICAVLAIPITKLLSGILFSERVIGFALSKIASLLPSAASTYISEVQALIQGEETGKTVSELVKLALSLPIILLLPIAFIVVFILLCVVGHIIAIVLEALVCPKTKNIWLKLLGGALTGASAGLIILTLLTPAVGYVNFTVDTIEYFKTSTAPPVVAEATQNEAGEPTKSEKINSRAYGVMDIIIKYVEPVKNTPVSKAIYTCGGKGIFNILTTTEVSKIDINLQKEINGAVDIYDSVMAFVDDSPKYYGEKQTEAVEKANEALSGSEFLPLLLSKTISFTANEFYQGHTILGIEKPNLGEDINPTLDRILAVLKDTDSDAIRGDIVTLSNIANGTVESGVIDKITADEKDIWGIFEDEEFVEIILVELYKNERSRNMVPYLTGAITNYVYKMYGDVNDTYVKPDDFNYDSYNEDGLKQEAFYIASSVKEIHYFIENTDLSSEMDPKEIILNADLGALGRGLEYLREGIFTERLFDLLLKSILESEAIDELGIIDSYIIETATKPNADLEGMLVSRQNILKLAIAIKDKPGKEETKELMDSVIESLLTDDGESLSSLISQDNLTSLGMSEDDAKSVEGIVGSMLDGANSCEFETEEEKQAEIEKTEEIISAVGNTVLDKNKEHMFKTDESDTSTTGMNADEFVNKITDSKLTSSMIQSAVTNENGEAVEDPYNIQGQISESDKNEISQAINNNYNAEDATDEEKATLEALAGIFGVTIE